MMGKWMAKAAILLVTISVVVLFGTRLLASLTVTVLQARAGNPSTLIWLIFLALGVLFIDGRFKGDSKPKLVLKAVAWSAAGYAALAFGFTLLVFGKSVSIFGGMLFLLLCAAVRNPVRQKQRIKSFSNEIKGAFNAKVIGKDRSTEALTSKCTAFLIPHIYSRMIVTLMEERPLLPVCLVRFKEADAFIVNCQNGSDWSNGIKELLETYGVAKLIQLSPEVGRFIGSLSYLNTLSGIDSEGLCMATDSKTVSRILADPPVRATIIPSSDGPNVIVHKSEALGMNLTSLSAGAEESVLLEKHASIADGGMRVDSQTVE